MFETMTSRIDVEILEARDNDVLIPPMGLRAFFFGKMLKKVATFVLAHSAPSTYTTVRLRVQVSRRPRRQPFWASCKPC